MTSPKSQGAVGYPDLDIENKCWLILGEYDLDMLVLTCGTNDSYVFTRPARRSPVKQLPAHQ